MESVLEEKKRDFKIILTREGKPTWIRFLNENQKRVEVVVWNYLKEDGLSRKYDMTNRFIALMDLIKNQGFYLKNRFFSLKP